MPLRCWVDPSSRAKEFVSFIGYIWLFRSSYGLVALVVRRAILQETTYSLVCSGWICCTVAGCSVAGLYNGVAEGRGLSRGRAGLQPAGSQQKSAAGLQFRKMQVCTRLICQGLHCRFFPLSLDANNNVQNARFTNCPNGTIEFVSLVPPQSNWPTFNIHELSPFSTGTY